MLGLLILFFLARWVFQLAEEHKKNKWLFAILTIPIYYTGTFLAGGLLGVIAVLSNNESMLDLPRIAYILIALPAGLLSVWAYRGILKRTWKNQSSDEGTILDDSL